MQVQTVTRSVEADAEPDRILEFLADPRHIPDWAPVFADRIDADGEGAWRVAKGASVFGLEVILERSSRTVDYLREVAPGRRGGAYIRVLPRPKAGSVIVMTLPVPQGVDAESVSEVLDHELHNLVNLLNARAGTP